MNVEICKKPYFIIWNENGKSIIKNYIDNNSEYFDISQANTFTRAAGKHKIWIYILLCKQEYVIFYYIEKVQEEFDLISK